MKKFTVRATVAYVEEVEEEYDVYAKDLEDAMSQIREQNFENVVDSRKLWGTISNEDDIVSISISDVEEVKE